MAHPINPPEGETIGPAGKFKLLRWMSIELEQSHHTPDDPDDPYDTMFGVWVIRPWPTGPSTKAGRVPWSTVKALAAWLNHALEYAEMVGALPDPPTPDEEPF